LARPRVEFARAVPSRTSAVVPPGVGTDPRALEPAGFVGSGAYTLQSTDDTKTVIAANHHYSDGKPAIPTITAIHDIGGRSPVQAFEDGDVDLTNVFPFDATWIAYDDALGPQLRQGASLSTSYYGFDTTKPPFDDVRVRQAFAKAVDWRRLVSLVAGPTATVATSMVPTGIPGRSDTDFLPD